MRIDRPWRRDLQVLRDWCDRQSDALPKRPERNTELRKVRNRRRRQATERVLRWQQRHPRTYARKMRLYRARKKRERLQTPITAEA